MSYVQGDSHIDPRRASTCESTGLQPDRWRSSLRAWLAGIRGPRPRSGCHVRERLILPEPRPGTSAHATIRDRRRDISSYQGSASSSVCRWRFRLVGHTQKGGPFRSPGTVRIVVLPVRHRSAVAAHAIRLGLWRGLRFTASSAFGFWLFSQIADSSVVERLSSAMTEP
jgi:hypothetical protein